MGTGASVFRRGSWQLSEGEYLPQVTQPAAPRDSLKTQGGSIGCQLLGGFAGTGTCPTLGVGGGLHCCPEDFASETYFSFIV